MTPLNCMNKQKKWGMKKRTAAAKIAHTILPKNEIKHINKYHLLWYNYNFYTSGLLLFCNTFLYNSHAEKKHLWHSEYFLEREMKLICSQLTHPQWVKNVPSNPWPYPNTIFWVSYIDIKAYNFFEDFENIFIFGKN